MNESNQENLLSIEQASSLLNVSQARVTQMMATGLLPSVSGDKGWLIKEQDVIDFRNKISKDDLLSVRQVAGLLNVSEPYVIKLIREGAMPFVPSDDGSLIKMQDAIEFKKAQDARSAAAMQELADEAQELGMYG